MAIAELTTQRNTNGGAAGTSVTFTFPVAPTAGNLVAFGFSWRGDATVTAVPHSCSLAMNGGNGSGIDSAIYYKIATGSEGTTWTFTLSSSQKFAGVASEWSGIHATPLDKTNGNTGTGTAGTTNAPGILAQADELVLVLFSNINTNTWSLHDNGLTEIGEAASTGGSTATRNNTSFASKVVSSTASVNYGATLSGSQTWSSAIATFKAAPNAFSLTADSAAFSVSGTAATLKKGSKLTADSAAFSVSGTAAMLSKGRKIVADSAAFTVSGIAAELRTTRKIAADSAAFSVTGIAATLAKGRKITAESLAVVWSGTAATFDYSGLVAGSSWLPILRRRRGR